MQTLELNGLQELNQEELANIDGGGILDDIAKGFGKYVFKLTDNGTLLDGIKGNTNIDCYIFGKKIF